VLRAASLAALITAAACYPRLALWTDRPYSLWFALLVLAWAAFVLWSFVFGWLEQSTGRSPFRIQVRPLWWSVATACGLAGALILHVSIDGVLRPLMPGDYPTNLQSWLALSLFTLTFDQLFLCFAPFAFFVRLFRSPRAAGTCTVLFGVLLVYLKVRAWSDQFSLGFLYELVGWRAGAGWLSVFLLLRGGVPMALWWIFLLQLRHLVWW